MSTYQEAVEHMAKGYSAEHGRLYRVRNNQLQMFDGWWQPTVLELSQVASSDWRLGGT